jgi:hypothetical protein
VDLNRIIQDLKVERDRLAAAIECLEQLAAGRARKRGRPPAWLKERGEGTQPSNADAPKNDSERPPAGVR